MANLTARVPFDGDPHDLVGPLEAALGSVICYRAGTAGERGQLRFASLARVWQIWPDGIRRGDATLAGSVGDARALSDAVRTLFTIAEAEAAAEGEDIFFALSYELSWVLRQGAGVPGAAPAHPYRMLGFVGPVRWVAAWDEQARALAVDPRDEAEVSRAVAHAVAAGPTPTASPSEPLTEVLSDLDASRYQEQVSRAREHLHRGDIYQVVISQPVRVRPLGGPHRYFTQVARRYASADFTYFASLAGVRILGACSLPHLLRAGPTVRTRVFAGTQPAARVASEVAAVGHALRTDPKYYSEHVMLVDLERNDLGQYCAGGSVDVDRLLQPLVIGPTTYLASDVQGECPPGLGAAEIVLASFPRGVVTGAPKLRAQEIIGELEGEPRGFYTGAMGVLEAGGSGQPWRITANTIVTCAEQRGGDELVLRCGGGLVIGSEPAQELRELDLKLRFLR